MTVDAPKPSSAGSLARALELCDRALDHLDVRDKPNGERPSVDEVIVLVEAVRTELVTILQGGPSTT